MSKKTKTKAKAKTKTKTKTKRKTKVKTELKTKTGKLSLEEKYAIQGMLHQDKNIEEIEGVLNRSGEEVKDYVEYELDRIQNVVAESQLDILDEMAEFINGPIYTRIKRSLTSGSVDELGADRILKKILDNATEIPGEDELYNTALRSIRSGTYMGRGGRYGNEYAVMSKVASERGDIAKQNYPKEFTSRTARKAIYRPNTGKIE